MLAPGRLRPLHWGPRLVALGVFIAIVSQVLTTIVAVGATRALGHDFRPRDIGDDVFDRAGRVVQWSDERLKAATEGTELPEPPELFAELTALRVGFTTTFVHEVALIVMVAALIKRLSVKGFVETFRLRDFSFSEAWVPAAAAVGMYVFVIAYQAVVFALGIEALEPVTTVGLEITRDPVLVVMAGVLACIAAPAAEETFFRGFVFAGLLRWGFWPAALLSGALFSAAHYNLGSLIPFAVVGGVLAWLYWRRGVLWDSIIFHFLFNATSYVLLLTRS